MHFTMHIRLSFVVNGCADLSLSLDSFGWVRLHIFFDSQIMGAEFGYAALQISIYLVYSRRSDGTQPQLIFAHAYDVLK